MCVCVCVCVCVCECVCVCVRERERERGRERERERERQHANFAHLLTLPFSAFPLYAHTRLVKSHFVMLRRQSGTLSLTKSGHPASSRLSNLHLILIFFRSPTDCVCGGGGGRGGERDWLIDL